VGEWKRISSSQHISCYRFRRFYCTNTSLQLLLYTL